MTMGNELQIIDVVATRVKGMDNYRQYMVVFNRMPVLTAERSPLNAKRESWLRRSDGDMLYSFLKHEPGTRNAFAGREFDIAMADGTIVRAVGDYWSSYDEHNLFPDTPRLAQVGYTTLEELKHSNTAYAGAVNLAKMQAWVDAHGLCTDRYKYDRHDEEWAAGNVMQSARYLLKVVGPQRRRTLRKRGVRIFETDVGKGYSPYYEDFVNRREAMRKFDAGTGPFPS